ncbi:MAG: M28 family peptidase [Bacteroidetes bacterium]|nr:M28 family peptidase [Bacteroidota bacterium]
MNKFFYSSILIFVLISCENQNKPIQNSKVTTLADTIHLLFDKEKAWDNLIKQTSFGPRNPNSIGHQRCLLFLQNELKQYSNSTQLFPFQQFGYNENLYLTNIFASFRPDLKKRILLLAHWDTRPRSDEEVSIEKQNFPIIGANDGASGVAVLLEVARILKNNPPEVGVDILFVDGEDYGKKQDLKFYSLGAKYFIKKKPATYQPQFAILLDMVGDKNLEIYKEKYSSRFAPSLTNEVWKRASNLNLHQFKNETRYEIYDDHIVLNEQGIPTIDIIDFDYEFWHTTNDTPDKCSKESLNAVGKLILNIIYKFPHNI